MSDSPKAMPPTREEIWNGRSARKAFPASLVQGARTAACFFSAAFYGRNDVVFLDHAGVPDIVLVDLMAEKLEIMAAMYPGVTETYADDAFDVARQLVRDQRTFDVVITDPFVPLTWPVLTEHFGTFSALARDLWVTGVLAKDLEAEGVPATLEGVQTWLSAKGDGGFDAVWLEVRNSDSRVCWLGLRRRRSAWARFRDRRWRRT